MFCTYNIYFANVTKDTFKDTSSRAGLGSGASH